MILEPFELQFTSFFRFPIQESNENFTIYTIWNFLSLPFIAILYLPTQEFDINFSQDNCDMDGVY